MCLILFHPTCLFIYLYLYSIFIFTVFYIFLFKYTYVHEHENFRVRAVNSTARLMVKLDADIGMRGKKLYSQRRLCVAGLFFQPEHPYCHQI